MTRSKDLQLFSRILFVNLLAKILLMSHKVGILSVGKFSGINNVILPLGVGWWPCRDLFLLAEISQNNVIVFSDKNVTKQAWAGLIMDLSNLSTNS